MLMIYEREPQNRTEAGLVIQRETKRKKRCQSMFYLLIQQLTLQIWGFINKLRDKHNDMLSALRKYRISVLSTQLFKHMLYLIRSE